MHLMHLKEAQTTSQGRCRFGKDSTGAVHSAFLTPVSAALHSSVHS